MGKELGREDMGKELGRGGKIWEKSLGGEGALGLWRVSTPHVGPSHHSLLIMPH
jgi:hypothetical protein